MKARLDHTEVPRLGLGCVRLGSVSEGNGWAADVRLVRDALDCGVTVFDTADVYGNGMSERVLGEALRGRRDEVVIATKVGYVHRGRSRGAYRGLRAGLRATQLARSVRPSPSSGSHGPVRASSNPSYQRQDFSVEYLTKAVEASLRRLRTDHVDVLFLHGPPSVMIDVIDGLEPLRTSGKAVRIGIGAETGVSARAWLDSPARDCIDVVQLPFGLLDPGLSSLLNSIGADGVDVWARGVLGSGLIPLPQHRPASTSEETWAMASALAELARDSGVGLLELAFAYVRSHDVISTTLVGVRSREHLTDDVRIFEHGAVPPLLIAEAAAIIDRWDSNDEQGRELD